MKEIIQTVMIFICHGVSITSMNKKNKEILLDRVLFL